MKTLCTTVSILLGTMAWVASAAHAQPLGDSGLPFPLPPTGVSWAYSLSPIRTCQTTLVPRLAQIRR